MSKTRDWIIGSIVYYLINERKKLLSKTTTNSRQLTFSWCSKILRTHGKSIRSCVSCYAQLPIFLENQLKASSLALGQFLTRCHESSSRHIRGQVELITNDFEDRYEKIITNGSQCENQVNSDEKMDGNAAFGTLFLAEEVLGKFINGRLSTIWNQSRILKWYYISLFNSRIHTLKAAHPRAKLIFKIAEFTNFIR